MWIKEKSVIGDYDRSDYFSDTDKNIKVSILVIGNDTVINLFIYKNNSLQFFGRIWFLDINLIRELEKILEDNIYYNRIDIKNLCINPDICKYLYIIMEKGYI